MTTRVAGAVVLGIILAVLPLGKDGRLSGCKRGSFSYVRLSGSHSLSRRFLSQYKSNTRTGSFVFQLLELLLLDSKHVFELSVSFGTDCQIVFFN